MKRITPSEVKALARPTTPGETLYQAMHNYRADQEKIALLFALREARADRETVLRLLSEKHGLTIDIKLMHALVAICDGRDLFDESFIEDVDPILQRLHGQVGATPIVESFLAKVPLGLQLKGVLSSTSSKREEASDEELKVRRALRQLRSFNMDERKAAESYLSQNDVAPYLSLLHQRLLNQASTDAEVSQLALILSNHASEDSCAPLLNAYARVESKGCRTVLVRTFAKLPCKDSDKILALGLRELLAEDSFLVCAALQLCAKFSTPTLAGTIIGFLRHEDSSIRSAALEALLRSVSPIGTPEITTLIEYLGSPGAIDGECGLILRFLFHRVNDLRVILLYPKVSEENFNLEHANSRARLWSQFSLYLMVEAQYASPRQILSLILLDELYPEGPFTSFASIGLTKALSYSGAIDRNILQEIASRRLGGEALAATLTHLDDAPHPK